MAKSVGRWPRSVRLAFWEAVGRGLPVDEAARVSGVHGATARGWFVQAGGVKANAPRPWSGRYLSFEEREQIALGRAAGHSAARIAWELGRHKSTICRELARNHRAGRPDRYTATHAQACADARARRPKPVKLAVDPALRKMVQEWLHQWWSPRQIALRLRREFPDRPEMWVSHETIYQALYVQGRGALRRELAACLRTGRALRKPRRRADARRRRRIPDMVMISERPAEAADRAVPGHWEGDLILGKDQASAIGTLVERATRYVMLLHLPNGRDAAAVRDAMLAKIAELPAHLWRSLTWDQGIEMARHREITIATGLPIYFCDPHSPWQRGSNENTNGLLRQYFPKGTDLSAHTAEHLDAVAVQLNGRPRETLNARTPAEALNQLLSHPFKPPSVATTA